MIFKKMEGWGNEFLSFPFTIRVSVCVKLNKTKDSDLYTKLVMLRFAISTLKLDTRLLGRFALLC